MVLFRNFELNIIVDFLRDKFKEQEDQIEQVLLDEILEQKLQDKQRAEKFPNLKKAFKFLTAPACTLSGQAPAQDQNGIPRIFLNLRT